MPIAAHCQGRVWSSRLRRLLAIRHGCLWVDEGPFEAVASHVNSAMERRRLRIPGPLSMIPRFIGDGGNDSRPASLLISL